jgi:hypothetical protein
MAGTTVGTITIIGIAGCIVVGAITTGRSSSSTATDEKRLLREPFLMRQSNGVVEANKRGYDQNTDRQKDNDAILVAHAKRNVSLKSSFLGMRQGDANAQFLSADN